MYLSIPMLDIHLLIWYILINFVFVLFFGTRKLNSQPWACQTFWWINSFNITLHNDLLYLSIIKNYFVSLLKFDWFIGWLICGTGYWTQNLMNARQAHYHWARCPALLFLYCLSFYVWYVVLNPGPLHGTISLALSIYLF